MLSNKIHFNLLTVIIHVIELLHFHMIIYLIGLIYFVFIACKSLLFENVWKSARKFYQYSWQKRSIIAWNIF